MRQDPLLLTRRDPSRNMARFYSLSISADLSAEVALTRNWGRIGTKGRFRIDLFGTADEAEQRFHALAVSKTRRGYRRLDEAS